MTEGTPAMPYFHLFDSVALAEHRWPNHMREPITLGVRAPCSVRPDKTLTDGEGPHAKSWLTARGDTVQHQPLRFRHVGVAYRMAAQEASIAAWCRRNSFHRYRLAA